MMADRERIIAKLSNALVQMHGCGRYTPDDVDELEKAGWDALELLKEQERQIIELKEKLRLMEYGDQESVQSLFMPAT